MSRLRERISPRYLPLIIGGASAAVAGLPLFYVAIALSAPSLLAVPIVGIAVMLLGFFVAPRGPVEPRASKPGEGEVKNLSEEEFDALLAEVERSAGDPGRPEQLVREDRFEQLVRDALDELPAFAREDLANGQRGGRDQQRWRRAQRVRTLPWWNGRQRRLAQPNSDLPRHTDSCVRRQPRRAAPAGGDYCPPRDRPLLRRRRAARARTRPLTTPVAHVAPDLAVQMGRCGDGCAKPRPRRQAS